MDDTVLLALDVDLADAGLGIYHVGLLNFYYLMSILFNPLSPILLLMFIM